MSIGEKSFAIRKPGCRHNLPVYFRGCLGQEQCPYLVSSDRFDMHPLLVDVGEKFPIGRNRRAGYLVFRRIGNEQYSSDIGAGLRRIRLVSEKPENAAGE